MSQKYTHTGRHTKNPLLLNCCLQNSLETDQTSYFSFAAYQLSLNTITCLICVILLVSLCVVQDCMSVSPRHICKNERHKHLKFFFSFSESQMKRLTVLMSVRSKYKLAQFKHYKQAVRASFIFPRYQSAGDLKSELPNKKSPIFSFSFFLFSVSVFQHCKHHEIQRKEAQ